MLRLACLSLFVRIILKSPPVLLDMIVDQAVGQFQKGWTKGLQGDLRWLSACEHFSHCVSFDIHQWVTELSSDPKRSLNRITTVCKTPYVNICPNWATTAVLKDHCTPIVCYLCGHVSESLQQHSVHLSSSHSIKSKWRKYVDGSVCTICLKQFWTRERCLNHISHRSQVCRANALMRGPRITQEESDRMDKEGCACHRTLHANGKRRHKSEIPPIQTVGPLLLVIAISHSNHHSFGQGHNYY